MRHSHMKLLFHNRDKAVREGIRNEGLTACRSCHKHRDKFCEKCHDYIGVEPECWNCHNYPA